MRISNIMLSLTVILLAAVVVAADDKKGAAVEDGKYTVSAKAGIVSVITGNVTFKRGKDGWQTLVEGVDLKADDAIKTSSTGRVEILLNPGTYLRIGENSEVVFSDLNYYRLKISLLSGSAILEAGVVDSAIKMTTPQYVFTVARTGVYRFNVDASGISEMLVRKGKINIAGVEIKDGKKVVVDNAPPSVLAFDKKAEDSFDMWSKDRAKTIIAANKKLNDNRMRSSLNGGFGNSYWIYDPFFRSYTFLPGWNGFSSPYGGNYSHCNPNGNQWWGNNGGNRNWSGGNSSGGSPGGYVGGGRSTGGSTGGSTSGGGSSTGNPGGGGHAGGSLGLGGRSETPHVSPPPSAPHGGSGGKIRDN
jgi:hypothetical protein